MVLKMKNFNILGVHWTIRLLGGGGELTKNQYRVGIAWKEGLGQFANLGGGLGKKEWVVFLRGVLILQCTLWDTSLNLALVQNLSIQNHLNHLKNWRNKTEKPSWNLVKIEFAKNSRLLNSAINLNTALILLQVIAIDPFD